MKQFIFSALAIVGLLSFISCERHDWEDSADGAKDGTKNLYPKEKKTEKHTQHDQGAGNYSSSEEQGH